MHFSKQDKNMKLIKKIFVFSFLVILYSCADYSLKNHTWFNIGGNAKVFFVPETLSELRDFLLYIKRNNNNFFIIGAGSNLLISENIQNRIFYFLGDLLILRH